jgi:hypothetical protein
VGGEENHEDTNEATKRAGNTVLPHRTGIYEVEKGKEKKDSVSKENWIVRYNEPLVEI